MKKLFLLSISLALLIASFAAGCASEPKIAKDPGIYKVGDTGPGGGIIFFAENGRYLECSPSLGRSAWDAAKDTVKNYRGGRKSDWRLPSMNELNLMYNNLRLQGLGSFNLDRFWSSEQDADNADNARNVNFLDGAPGSARKTFTYSVRAVRIFEN
jgi:hypothetical protein